MHWSQCSHTEAKLQDFHHEIMQAWRKSKFKENHSLHQNLRMFGHLKDVNRHRKLSMFTSCHKNSGNNYNTVKPLSFLYALFSHNYHSFSLVLTQRPYKQCIIISDALFLKVLFSHDNHSEFLVPTHNIQGMIVSEKNSESKLMFLECTAAICPHYLF
jgi:hypothetical protein